MIIDWLTNPTVFAILAIWSVAWKAVSLWRSARRGQRLWFGILLVINTLGILDMVYIFLVARDKKSPAAAAASERLQSLNAERAAEKIAAEERIMSLFSGQAKITNNDVEKELGVADATAERYLAELEKDGKIVQNGEAGRGVFYTKSSTN